MRPPCAVVSCSYSSLTGSLVSLSLASGAPGATVHDRHLPPLKHTVCCPTHEKASNKPFDFCLTSSPVSLSRASATWLKLPSPSSFSSV